MYKIFSSFIILSFVVIFLFVPKNIFAAQMIFKLIPNTVIGDGSTIIEVRLDPESKDLNVIEGEINLKGIDKDKLLVDIETGGSILTTWPTLPKYISSESVIRFTGGVPGGFNKENLLFRLRLASSIAGNITLSFTNGTAYLNDGLGTMESIFTKPIVVSLEGKDIDLINKTSLDNTPPYFEYINIGKDPNTYDGKYFISFQALDDISGVARYEIKEGNVITVITNGVYIFQDQHRGKSLTITAYDQAGNSVVTKIPAKFYWLKYVTIILLLIIIFLFIFRKKYIKNKKRNNNV